MPRCRRGHRTTKTRSWLARASRATRRLARAANYQPPDASLVNDPLVDVIKLVAALNKAEHRQAATTTGDPYLAGQAPSCCKTEKRLATPQCSTILPLRTRMTSTVSN